MAKKQPGTALQPAPPIGPEEMRGEIERHTGRRVQASTAADLAEYVRLLAQWNERMNLVGSKHWKEIVRFLLLDSLFLAEYLSELDLPEHPEILDIGAGAGIPGIPLRICRSQGAYHLIEPRQKRAAFLQFVLSRLRLPQTRVHRSRLEDLPQQAFSADLALSRGFRRWDAFLSLAKPFLKPGGLALIFSSHAWSKEHRPPPGWAFREARAYHPAPVRTTRYFWLFGLKKASS